MEPAARGLETPCPIRAAVANRPRPLLLPGLLFCCSHLPAGYNPLYTLLCVSRPQSPPRTRNANTKNRGTTMKTLLAALMISVAGAMPALTDDDPKKDDGFVPMFNGTDLTGWVNVNCAPGTFFVKDKHISTTDQPTRHLRTDKPHQNV